MLLTAHSDGRLVFDGRETRCALGAAGVVEAAAKREGDGASPAGRWPLRRGFWRADRLARPDSALVFDPIADDDGWCDDPRDPGYNRLVRRAYPASSEAMTRGDELYDIVVVLGHNDDPPVAGAGSAIFLHCAKPSYPPTRGCIALARADLLEVLAAARPGDLVEIRV